MRKRELARLHALRSYVRRYAERRHDVPADAFDRYDRMEVPPAAIYRGKVAHEEARDRSLSDLRSALATHVDEGRIPRPPRRRGRRWCRSAGADPSRSPACPPCCVAAMALNPPAPSVRPFR
jgi:hypothetical protein